MTPFMLDASQDRPATALAGAATMRPSREARFRRLLEAAWLAGGDMVATAQRLGIGYTLFGNQLSRLRTKGLARTVTLIILGGPGQLGVGRAYVRLPGPRAADLAAFEAFLRTDPAVETAAFVTGPDAYQLTTLHANQTDLKAWRLKLERRFPGIEIVMHGLRVRHGHEMASLPLVPPPVGLAGLFGKAYENDDPFEGVADGDGADRPHRRSRAHPMAETRLGAR
jgi:hypothetical protein